jgi:hypothetical protein
MFLGTIEHLTSRWILMDKPKDLTECANDTADLIVNAVKNPPQDVNFINSTIHLEEKGGEMNDGSDRNDSESS